MVNSLIPLTRVDDLFDGFFTPRLRRGTGEGQQSIGHSPRADILEGDQDYLIRVDVPGVDREAVDINVEDQVLTLKAERELPAQEGYRTHRRELPGKLVFRRTFRLGKEIDADSISAKLDRGVLTITLPKAETALPRRIDVK